MLILLAREKMNPTENDQSESKAQAKLETAKTISQNASSRICTENELNKTRLDENNKTVLDGILEKSVSLKCIKCGCQFQLKGNLKRHLATVHLKFKEFKCHECGNLE